MTGIAATSPTDHPDYDAFYDATDNDLAGMASEAINRFHNRTWWRS